MYMYHNYLYLHVYIHVYMYIITLNLPDCQSQMASAHVVSTLMTFGFLAGVQMLAEWSGGGREFNMNISLFIWCTMKCEICAQPAELPW